MISEAQAKDTLADYGLRVPHSRECRNLSHVRDCSDAVGFPQVLKGAGISHKTEAGAVRLNLTSCEETYAAARSMRATGFLIEEMIVGTVVELLIGVVCDPAHGFVLTLGAGGIHTELLQDSVSLVLPVTDADVTDALGSLKMAPLLSGYRGAPAADMPAILSAVRAIQAFALSQAENLQEIEVNPLICTPTDAIAADVLLCSAL